MESKKGNASLYCVSSSKVSNTAVGLSFKSGGCWCCAEKLKGNLCQDCCKPPCSNVAVAHALFDAVKTKLVGNALDVQKTKVSNVEMHLSKGQCGISWNTHTNLSAVRKTLKMAVA